MYICGMKKKEQVFVHVKDIDESRELLKVLKESGEPIFIGTEEGLESFSQSQQLFPYIYFDGECFVGNLKPLRGKTEATIHELRQILSGETLNTDIAKLKDKYPDYCFTIIVEKR